MKISTLYQFLFFLIPYLYLNRAWLCDNCKVQQLSTKPWNVYTKLKYVLTTAWYRNKRYLFYMRGSREGQGVRSPLINHKNIGFLSNTGPDPHKNSQSYKASVKCLAIIDPPVKRRLIGVSLSLYGVSLAGRWWPAFSAICIIIFSNQGL